jgi:hypothetical protein
VQEERYHGGAVQVRLVHVAVPELHAVRHARLARVGLRPRDEPPVDLDPDATCAELLGGHDRNAAIARSEVEHHIVWPDLGQLQHRADDGHRRRVEAHLPAGHERTPGHHEHADHQPDSHHQVSPIVPRRGV